VLSPRPSILNEVRGLLMIRVVRTHSRAGGSPSTGILLVDIGLSKRLKCHSSKKAALLVLPAVVCDSGRSDGCVCWLFVCMGVAGSAVPVIGGEVWLCVCVCVGGGMNV